jgi:dihydrofolate reductase
MTGSVARPEGKRMRKIVVHMSVSVDGYFEGPDREIDWHLVDDEVHAYVNDGLRTMSAFLQGRLTYELMEEFWPTADQDPDAGAPVVDFTALWRDIPKIVFSRTMARAGSNATVRHEVDPAEIRALQQQPGGDMTLGGADLADTFRRHDLIDEYRLFVHPVLLGRGRRLFGPSGAPDNLRLTETRVFGNGVVLLRYDVVRPG